MIFQPHAYVNLLFKHSALPYLLKPFELDGPPNGKAGKATEIAISIRLWHSSAQTSPRGPLNHSHQYVLAFHGAQDL